MEIPNEYILAGVITLCGTISGMAGIMWMFMKERLSKQDIVISNQGETIKQLQHDIDRLSGGCGMDSCVWRKLR